MNGNSHRWQSIMAGVLFLAGCVGLGDSPSDTVAANKPKPRPTVEPSAPELRIADDTVAQAASDIPIVPVPPPPVSRPLENRTATVGERPSQPLPDGRGSDRPQPDGTTPTPAHTARQLVQEAAARCAQLNSYIVRLTRRESLKGKPGPEEIIAFSFRKQPFSVHLKWLGKTAEGREVVYVKDRFDNKIHTKVAAGDSLLLPAGARLSLSPDNLLVRSASRHPITDAGICKCVESLVAFLDALEHGDRRQGTLTVLAPQQRPEYPKPVETLERIIPPGVEPELPRGGRRLMYFDPDWRLPMLVITYDDKGNEVEYYRYDRLMAPANLDDDDFNPDKLWQQKVRSAEPRP
ncbi:MAG TPA: DUF1571 domain-containing protein [Gemmataceae bacterium]|nr:DUF1571 domain-containing protein [Gemmataceae bacterium]